MAQSSDRRSLAGRSALVTGSGNGLGLSIAEKIVSRGGRVFLVDCDPKVLERPSGFPQGTSFALVKDLADEDAAGIVFKAALAALGRVDTLVNNAAWSLHKTMLEMRAAEFDRLVAINQRAPYFLAQEFARQIAENRAMLEAPSIVNISSVNALAGFSHLVAYAGTKGALVAMTHAMAVELAPLNIRVNSISPGMVDTPALRRVIAERRLSSDILFDGFLIQRPAACEEIAELVAYLCSPAASYVDGANWLIDGGYSAQ